MWVGKEQRLINSLADNLQFHTNQKWDLPPRPSLNPEGWEGKQATLPSQGSPTFLWVLGRFAKKLEEVWHAPARTRNASAQKQRYGILGQPGLQTKFEGNLGYVVKSCFEINFKEINKDSQKDW